MTSMFGSSNTFPDQPVNPPMTFEDSVSNASHSWCAERSPVPTQFAHILPPRRVPPIDERLGTMLPFLFQTLAGMHAAVISLPPSWPQSRMSKMLINGSRTRVINLGIPAGLYMLLRSAISLAGDAELMVRCLVQPGVELAELAQPFAELQRALGLYRPIRN